MQKVLSQRVADSAKPTAKPYQIHDPAIPGLVLRVQPSGSKFWKLIRDRRPVTLGRSPTMTYGMAAERALGILRGELPDPAAPPEPPPPPPPAPMTFGGFLKDHYIAFLKARHSRPDESLAALKRFKLDDKPLAEIRLADVETWRIERRAKGTGAVTINRDVVTLRAALQRAVDWDLLPVNPLARLKPLRTDRRGVVRFLTPEEEIRLLNALRARDAAERAARERANHWRTVRGYELLPPLGEYCDHLTPLVQLALHTGCRRGELWQLTWGDVDLRLNILTVRGRTAKSGQTRRIPLNATAQGVLKILRGDSIPLASVPVFGRHEFKKAFAGVLVKAELEDLRFHDLRHSFASKLVTRGVPLNTVRELLGHTTLEMTLVYAHLAPDNLRAAVELLA